jgi:hypothetical protein
MKKLLLAIFIISNTVLSHSESIPIKTCKLTAENRKYMAELKTQGFSEGQIRDGIFHKNTEYKKKTDKEYHKYGDLATEEEIEFLIWMFNKKNINLMPEQIYSIVFNECFKRLKSKGY